MVIKTNSSENDLNPGTDPSQDEFDKLIEKNFSAGDERMMEDRAQKAADDDGTNTDEPSDSDRPPGDEDSTASDEAQSIERRHDDQVGRGYKQTKQKPGFVRRQLGKQNRIFLIGGSSFVLIMIALVVIFLALLPFKLLHIVDNLQSRFYATSENAVGNETNVLFSDYLRKYVMPALKTCPGATTRTCTPKNITGGGMVSQLFRGWRNARLEESLAKNYGLEFKYVPGSKRFYLKTSSTTGDGVDLGGDGIDGSPDGFGDSTDNLGDYIANKVPNSEFKSVSRSELRAATDNALGKDTNWKNVMYRYKVGRLLENKFGLERCVIICKVIPGSQAKFDQFADWKDNKTRAAKIVIASRVIAPLSDNYGIVMACIVDGCDSSATDSDGRPITAYDQKVQQMLDNYAAQYGEESVQSLIDTANQINEKGFQKYIIDKVVGTLIGRFGGDEATQATASDVADKAVPIVGWVNTAAEMVKFGAKIGPDAKKYAFVVNAAAMVGLYTTYRTFADETKSGHVDPTILGSFSDSLGAGDKTATGGVASAEQTPLYNYLINGNAPSSSVALGNLMDGKAYAASTSSPYTCSNGKPVPAGKLVCPEEELAGGNSVANSISSFFSPSNPITILANFWNSTAGGVLNSITGLFSGLLSDAPGFSYLTSYVGKAASPMIHFVTDQLIPTPFSNDMSGGRTFDLMAGGADVSGNDYAQNGLGGEKLSNRQLSTILDSQDQQDLQSYQSQPLIARLFDTNSQYSPVTKLAMAMPDGLSGAETSIASFFSNPFGKLFSSFGSIFNISHVGAATTVVNDPFGVTQYGYPLNDPTLATANQDPETYWANNCTSDGINIDWAKPVNAAWAASAGTTTNPDTGQPENDSTDPCLLIQSAAGSAGALFSTSASTNVLTPEDLGQ